MREPPANTAILFPFLLIDILVRRHALITKVFDCVLVLCEVPQAHAPQNVLRLGELDVVVTYNFYSVAPRIEKGQETGQVSVRYRLPRVLCEPLPCHRPRVQSGDPRRRVGGGPSAKQEIDRPDQ